MAYNYGLLWLNYGLLYGRVACCFRLLGLPGRVCCVGTYGAPGVVPRTIRGMVCGTRDLTYGVLGPL